MPIRTIEAFFEQAPLPLAMLEGSEHRFVFANSHYRNMFFNGKELAGFTVAEVLPEAFNQGFIGLLDKVYQSGETYRGLETPLTISQSGGESKKFVLNFVYQAMRDSSGGVTGVLVAAVDVTEQVHAREVVEKQQQWLESILNKMPIALLLIDPADKRIKFSNDSVGALFGTSLHGTLPLERYQGKVKLFDRKGELVPAEQIPSVRASRGEELNEEFTLETGEKRVQINAITKMIPASDGHEKTALLLLQDVTAIRDAEEHYRLLTELAPQMPFVADSEGSIIYFSPQWYEYTGFKEGLTEGWKWKDEQLHHPEDLDRTMKRWAEAIATGEPYEIEYRIKRHDGQYRWHLGRARPVRNSDGKITKWVGTNVDIHDQKNLQRELEAAKIQAEMASETKSVFLANMSHEIRTPLGAILGFTELLKNASMNEEARQFLEVIERNGHSLTRVIDDILDLSKVESGKLELEEIPFFVQDVLRDVITLLSDRARAKGIFLIVEESEALKNRVVSDPSRVRQILINLVGNAIKFTDKGGVTVSLRSRPAGEERVLVSIFIRDTGVGMTPEQTQKLFLPFVQADQSTSRKYGGTGLGLALSRKLAKALQGDVRIENCVYGEGCIFALDLELGLARNDSAQSNSSRLPESDKALRLNGMRVLVVDDSPDNRVLINRFLRKEGAVVSEAESGEDALSKAMVASFDVILMDIQMPGMDGYESLSALRAQGFSKPVIALTAHAMLEEKKRSLAAGFSDHVTKPVNQNALVTAIENIL